MAADGGRAGWLPTGAMYRGYLAMVFPQDDRTHSVLVVLDAWCTDNIRPWYQDHVYWDATLLRRLAGADIDIAARIPSDLICAAAEADPAMRPAVGAFRSMQAPPSVLDNLQDNARAVLRSGWRPRFDDGPDRDELAAALIAAVSSPERQAVLA